MKKLFFHFFGFFIIFFSYSFQLNAQSNQQLDLKDFVVFSFKNLNFEKKSKINSTGNIGSKKSIDLDKESVIKANLFSFETISFDKDNKITGNVYAYNNANDLNKKILDGKKDSKFTGDLFINGKIDIHKDSKITGSVRQPIGASYKGPTPTGGITNGPIVFSPMPNIPVVNGFSAGTNNISGNQTILPGTYGELKLNNEETLTLNGPGTYILF
jgi:hypothetical protein